MKLEDTVVMTTDEEEKVSQEIAPFDPRMLENKTKQIGKVYRGTELEQ